MSNVIDVLSVYRKAEKVICLQTEQWCHITVELKNGSTHFQEMIAPFESNPNVEIKLDDDSCSICIRGVPDAVVSAYDHVNGQLSRDLHVTNRLYIIVM